MKYERDFNLRERERFYQIIFRLTSQFIYLFTYFRANLKHDLKLSDKIWN